MDAVKERLFNEKGTCHTGLDSKLYREAAEPAVETESCRLARVSTDHDEQLTSYEAQVDYYTRYIQSRNNWEFVGMYTDEGISATNTKHRKGFKRMIDDAMTAHVSIVFARYTMLSLEQRRNADKRSIGDLFFASYDELQDLRYMDALLLILKKFIDRIKERMLFMEKELDEMLNSFLEKLPLLWHNCLKHCA